MKNFLARMLEGINNFASRLQLRLQKTANALKITMLPILRWGWRHVSHIAGYIGRQSARGTRWVSSYIKTKLPLAVWGFLCLVLATVAVKSIPLDNIEWKMVGWVALAGIVLTLLVWLLWSPARRSYTRITMQSGWFWWPLVLLLLVAVGIGTYQYFPPPAGQQVRSGLITLDVPDTTREFKLIPSRPVEVVIQPGWRLDWWGKSDEFESRAVWRGQNKVRIFFTKLGVVEAELKLRLYQCSTAAPC